MARGILWIVLAMCSLLLAGCSVAIIHPPSAATFMEKSDGAFLKSGSVSAYWGELIFSNKEALPKHKIKQEVHEDWYYYEEENPVQIDFSFQRSIGFFKYGVGLDFVTPYVEAGFFSKYLGLMGWSNLFPWQYEKVNYKSLQWGGGISLIEQLPIGNNLRLGLTQHLSRNGREGRTYGDAAGGGFGIPTPTPVFYDEIGGGGYVSFVPGEKIRIGVEFRYGRDLTYKRVGKNYNGENVVRDINRYSITASIIGW